MSVSHRVYQAPPFRQMLAELTWLHHAQEVVPCLSIHGHLVVHPHPHPHVWARLSLRTLLAKVMQLLVVGNL